MMKKLKVLGTMVFIIATFFAFLPLTSAVFNWSSGLVGYWDMDEGSGNTFDDINSAHTFTCDDTPCLWVDGFIGNAATAWNGTFGADGVTITNVDDFKDFSWSFWMNYTGNTRTPNTQWIIIHPADAGVASRFFTMQLNMNQMRFGVGDGALSNELIAQEPSNNTWHHIVGTYENDTGNQRFYIDGALAVEFGDNSGIGDAGSDLDIAKHATTHNEFFNGTLDELGYWNRTLTPSDIAQLYNRGAGMGFNNQTDVIGIDSVETESVLFADTINVSGTSVNSGTLFYDGSSNGAATISNLGGGLFNITRTINIPLLTGNATFDTRDWHYRINLANGTTAFTPNQSNFVDNLNLSICGNRPFTVPFINFTFKNETTPQERVSATFSSTWSFFAGTGAITKTFTFNNVTENLEYDFCGDPQTSTILTNPSITYDNDESQPRGYVPNTLTLSSTRTDTTLYLLPTSVGLFATIQVLNIAGNPISGAIVSIADPVLGVVEVRKTSDSGTATFFVDPFETYTVTASADGFATFTGTNMFSTSEFTIILGAATGVFVDGTAGITYQILPTGTFLNNNTDTLFSFEIGASLSNLQNYSFSLTNTSGSIIGTTSGSSAGGSTISITNNTENHGTITMGAVWTVNETIYEITKVWVVRDENFATQWSILNFFNRLSTYLNAGIFGLTPLGMGIIVFLIIFMTTGVLAFRFGLNSPIAITAVVFSLVAFFDVALGIFPNPVNAVDNFPTIVVGLIAISIIFREVFK